MLLTIRHETVYRYRKPVPLLPHRLMVRARGQQDLTVLTADLTCTPPGTIAWTQDVFGNLIATARFEGETDTLTIVSEMSVEQTAAAWPVFAIDPAAHNYPFAYSDDDRTDLGAYLTPRHADPDDRLLAWAKAHVAGPPTDTLALLKDVNAWMIGRIFYRTRDEEGTQTPLETIDLASGSCRDIATLFIEGVRRLGFGARAVSGYLFDPDSEDQHGATHAWAEVYLPAAGWIVFDPTNARVGGANLVPVAVARDITQIMPVEGSYVGAAKDFLDMIVDVSVTETKP
ncbi:MAG: transglutaminase family protein [Sphingomonas bacterium]|nr:transglutaminase family protein [Sphingomonas bacterium]